MNTQALMIARLDEWLCPVCVHMCVCAHAGTHEHKPARAWFGVTGGGMCTGVLCGNMIVLCGMKSIPVDEHRVCVHTHACVHEWVCVLCTSVRVKEMVLL